MLPRCEQIKQDLLREIKSHTFIPGDKFYSEADIKRKYVVSSIIAVEALSELASAGYLHCIQEKGTFVSRSKAPQNVKFSDIELHPLDSKKVKVLSIEEKNQAEILRELGLSANVSYYRIKRVYYPEDTPFLVYIMHLPKKLVKESFSKNLTAYASVYERVRRDLSVDLLSLASVGTNEIVFPEDVESLNLLRLSLREPAVKRVKHSYLVDGSVAEYTISYKHWKYFKTKTEVEAE